ncbi:hypothetical protein [Thermoactinospora rubra]|uniref:hypothetical protein n=1 Tax=Thermoactinospora rubra TaxID=1088767 RepID=UPI00117FFE91|nr:hypothetical protein [Thermoactinospora rubra]
MRNLAARAVRRWIRLHGHTMATRENYGELLTELVATAVSLSTLDREGGRVGEAAGVIARKMIASGGALGAGCVRAMALSPDLPVTR